MATPPSAEEWAEEAAKVLGVDLNVAEIWHGDLRWQPKLNGKTDLLGRSGKPPSVASRNSLSIAKIPPRLVGE